MTGTLVCLLGGLAIAWAALRPGAGARPLASYVLAVALAPGLGFGLASLLLVAGIALDLPRPTALAFLLVAGALAAAIYALSRRRKGERIARLRATGRRWTLAGVLGAGAAAVSLVFALNVFSHAATAWPSGTWDAVAIWNVRARFLDRAYLRAPELIARVHPSSHGNYPLLLSGAVAAEFGFEHEETPAVPAATALAFFVGTGLLAVAFCALAGSWPAGWWAAALFWATPIAVKWGAAQVADVPTGYYLLGGIGGLATLLPRAPADAHVPPAHVPPWLTGALLGLLAWTKNEGLPYFAVAVAVLALVLVAERALNRDRLRQVVGLLAGALPALAALAWMKVTLPESGLGVFLGGDWSQRVLDPARWLPPLAAIAARFAGASATVEWSGAWTALALASVFAAAAFGLRPVARACGYPLAAIAACALTWLPIYAVTPYDQTWHINSSMDRLFLQLYPAALMAVVLAFALPLRESRSGTGRREAATPLEPTPDPP